MPAFSGLLKKIYITNLSKALHQVSARSVWYVCVYFFRVDYRTKLFRKKKVKDAFSCKETALCVFMNSFTDTYQR